MMGKTMGIQVRNNTFRAVVAAFTFCLLSGAMTGSFALNATAAEGAKLTADEALKKARGLYGAGDFEGALTWLEYANNKAPKATIVYNIGRVQEKLGRLADAYNTFLRVTALSDVDEKIRGLSQAQAEKLKPLINKVMLYFEGLKPGAMVQIDEEMVLDLTADAETTPGNHQICVLTSGGKTLSCWRRKLAAGLRLPWPPKTASTTRGTLIWKGMKGAELHLNGRPLLVDLTALEKIKVDVGRHKLKLVGADGKEKNATVSVLSRGKKKLAAAFAKTSAGRSASTSKAVPEVPDSSGNIWPWVVTGTGVVLAGAGGALIVKSSSTREDYDETDALAAEAANNAANDESVQGGVLAGVGVLAVVGGITWWLLDKKGQENSQQANSSGPSIWFGVSGISTLSVSGRF